MRECLHMECSRFLDSFYNLYLVVYKKKKKSLFLLHEA